MEERERKGKKSDIVIIIAILIVVLFVGRLVGYGINNPYKRGQVDALNGNIKYELIENEDLTREWVRIPTEE